MGCWDLRRFNTYLSVGGLAAYTDSFTEGESRHFQKLPLRTYVFLEGKLGTCTYGLDSNTAFDSAAFPHAEST